MKILLIFTLSLISDGGASKEVTGYSGGGVLIKCKYDTEYTENKKYFCKGAVPGCIDQIKTGAKDMWIKSERVSLFDDTKSAEFRVMIRELTVQDAGTYHCGVDKNWIDVYTPVKLMVKHEVLGSREVSAYAGGGINIKCRYEDEYKDKPKSFCEIGTHQPCFNQITTKLNSEWSHDERFSIHDNRSAGFLSVFIRELIKEDTGTYMCAVVVSDKIEIYTVVKLSVREDQHYEKSISETVHVGGDLNISCKFPESHRSNAKFFCKRLGTDLCFDKTIVKESRKYVNMGKFTLYDDRAKQIFTVSMRDVTEQDSGEYWCGAEATWTSAHGYDVYFTQISLTVTDVLVSTLKSTQGLSSPSLSSSSSSFSSLFSSSSSSESALASPATGFPASTVITVSVILLLLLIGFLFLIVMLKKRHKTKAGAASTSRTSGQSSETDQGISLAVCEYEEIKDLKRLSASHSGMFTVYATAQLPTIPSDPAQSVYANTKLPTCDSVYSTAQLTTVYPSAQLRTQPSTEKSAEDLTYASVRFHSSSTTSDADPQIVFNKEKDSCDYALVSHVNS